MAGILYFVSLAEDIGSMGRFVKKKEAAREIKRSRAVLSFFFPVVLRKKENVNFRRFIYESAIQF